MTTLLQAKIGGRLTSGTSLSVAYASNNTATSLLVCHVVGETNIGSNGCTVTDTRNAYAACPLANNGSFWSQGFYVLSCGAGANTVSIAALGTNTFIFAALAEYSISSPTFDVSAAVLTSTAQTQTLNYTTTGSGDLTTVFWSQNQYAVGGFVPSAPSALTGATAEVTSVTYGSTYGDNVMTSLGARTVTAFYGAYNPCCSFDESGYVMAFKTVGVAVSDVVPMIGGGRRPSNATYLKR